MKARAILGLLIGILPALGLMGRGVATYYESGTLLESNGLYIAAGVCTLAGGVILATSGEKNKSLPMLFLESLTWMSVLLSLNFALAFVGCTCEALSKLK
jgi:hypothetical protein